MANNTKQADKLIQVSLSGDVSHIEDLLSKKVDVNSKNSYDQFPLLVASQNGHKEAVKLLIERGAHVNMESLKKVTSLSLASECGHHETVQVLLENGAHIDHGVSDGRTPLMLASENGHEETVRVLLSKKADVDLFTTSQTETALTIALTHKHAAVAKLLVPHVKGVDITDTNEQTPLMLAASYGFVDVVELLLTRGAKVNKKQNGLTALMVAARKSGSAEIASLLLKHGARIDVRSDDDGYSALIIACKHGYKDFIQVLLSHGAAVDLRAHSTGETALIAASEHRHAEIVKLLLREEGSVKELIDPATNADKTVSEQCMETSSKHCQDDVSTGQIRSPCADVDIIDRQGQTALSIASSRGDLEIVETLVRHGANVNQSKGEKSALSRAVASKNIDVGRVLIKNKASVQPVDIFEAIRLGLLEILQLIIPHCSNVDLQVAYHGHGSVHASALWWAVRYNNTPIVNLLLENGASVHNDVMSGVKLPCLVVATIQENIEIVKALLNKGADVDVTCGQKREVTPLMLAIFAGHIELVEVLVKYHANVFHTSKATWQSTVNTFGGNYCNMRTCTQSEFTCMDLAIAVGSRKVISILSSQSNMKKPRLDPDLLPAQPPAFPQSSQPLSDDILIELIQQEYVYYKDKICPDTSKRMGMYVPHNLSNSIQTPRLSNLFPENQTEYCEDGESDDTDNQVEKQLPVDTPPTLIKAYKVLLPVAAKWKNIGVLLDIEISKLKTIEADKKASEDALLDMIEEWLKKVEPPLSWNELVEAVTPFNPSVAQKIREIHCANSVLTLST